MLILCGLGNPGSKYERNRHNVGFLAVDEIVRRHCFSAWRDKFQAQISTGEIDGVKILVMKPQTFMNESGQAIGQVARFHEITPDRVIVLHDELDLPPGKLRAKKGGGAAGHNGIRSTISHIGNDFWRIRMGIGHPGSKQAVHGWVLGNFSNLELEAWQPGFAALADQLPALVAKDADAWMSKVSNALGKQDKKPPEAGQTDPGAMPPPASPPPAPPVQGQKPAKPTLGDMLRRKLGDITGSSGKE